MNEYEITKLKKELQRKNQLLKEEKQDREETEKQLVSIQAERDQYHGELLIARRTIENVDQIIAQNVKEMKLKLEHENSQALNQLQSLKDKLIEQRNLNQKLLEESRNKETVISDLSVRLREMSRKYKDSSLLVSTKEISEQATISHNKYYKLTEKYNKLNQDMENILTQNKILRKLHGVPQNFGFDLEQIKIAEKQELEDYKAQCRKLETQIEELQAQRTQLRYRLRQYNTLYSNKGQRYKDLNQRQLQMLDNYALNLKEGRVQQPQLDKSKKQMEKQIIRLTAQVETLKSRQPISMMKPMSMQSGEGSQRLSSDTMRRLQEQIRGTLEPFVQDIRKLNEANLNGLIQNLQSLQAVQGSQNSPEIAQTLKVSQRNQMSGGLKPPIPLPSSNNDWSKINEGYSYTYASKIPIDMKDVDNQLGFDVIKSRYLIAGLQLHNIESLKLLKEKQKNEDILFAELTDLKEKYKKCLKVQDDLFIKYFKEKEIVRENIKKLELEKTQLLNERDRLEAELSILKDSYNSLNTKIELEKKYKDYGERLSKAEAALVKQQRKYKIIHDANVTLRDAYSALQKKSIENQYNLREKYQVAKRNEKQLSMLMNQVLDETKLSVSSDVHNILLSKMEALKIKSTNFNFKEAELRVKISRLESIEREINVKDQVIEQLREDILDLSLELEIVRNRLSAADDTYKKYQQIFERLVKFINENSVSLVSHFKMSDKDRSGKLSKDQFHSALKALGFEITIQQMENIFSEFDLYGSGSLTYYEFMKKLRRGGAITKSKEEQAIYLFFKAITKANITIKKAFQIIDMDGSNSISKTEMETAFKKIGIRCDRYTIDAIFKISDGDFDGKISYTELEKLYQQIVKESAIQQNEIKVELDWKFSFILKIQQFSLRKGMTLQEFFKSLDEDGSNFITVTQLSELFRKCDLNVDRSKIDELFKFFDSRYDGKIQFAEFLQKLQEAKREKKRVDRLLFVQKRALQLKRQYEVDSSSIKGKIEEQVGLKVRLMGLETKQSHLVKRNDKLCRTIAKKEEENRQLERENQQSESSFLKLQDQFNKVKEQNTRLKEKLKNSLTQMESKRLELQTKKIKLQNAKITPQLQTFKGLYSALSTKHRDEELRVGKVEAERNKYYEIVKQYEGKSSVIDDVAQLKIDLEYSKRNEELTNKKLDQVYDQLIKIQGENKKLGAESMEKQQQIINTHVSMRENMNFLQAKVDNLTSKILPTINASKMEEFILKLREISSSKTQLQEQNQTLRQKNVNLQSRNDYIENQKIHLLELEKRLKRNYTDETSLAMMDLTKKLSEYKMNELKAKREASLLKEKEQYYMRINNSNNDNIRELQEQLVKWESKYNDREQFWRKKLSDQMKLMEDLQKQTLAAKKSQRQAVLYFKNQDEQNSQREKMYQNMDPKRKSQLKNFLVPSQGGDGDRIYQLSEQVERLKYQLQEKQKQVYKLRTTLQQIVPEDKLKFTQFGSQMQIQTNSFIMQTDLTSSQLKNNARRFLNNQKQQEQFFKQEAERMAQAAQQSIDTLQRIIDDKNEQIRRKDKAIDDLKKEMLKSKEEDCYEIQKLNEQIRNLRSKNEIVNINQIINQSTQKKFYQSSENPKVQELLEEKQKKILALQNKYDELLYKKTKVSSNGLEQKLIEGKMKEIQKQREEEKKQYIQNQKRLNDKNKNLEKLIRDKDKKLSQLNETLIQIKKEVVYEKKQLEKSDIEGNQRFILQMNKGNSSNDSRMELMLQKAMQTIQNLNKKNKQYETEVKKLRQEKIMGRTVQRR